MCKKMPDPSLVIVPFDDTEGRYMGDTSWTYDIHVPHIPNMTVEDVYTLAILTLCINMQEVDIWNTVDEFAEENCLNVTGGWIIEREIYDKLLVVNTPPLNGDSAVYTYNSTMKRVVAALAIDTIPKELN